MRRIKATSTQMSFSDYNVAQRSGRTSVFYKQIDIVVDWKKIEKVINRYYHKGETLSGSKPYSGLLLFKM